MPLALLAACAQPEWVPDGRERATAPERDYRRRRERGDAVYRVDPQQSRIFIRTGRDGPMKAAGHDHVIASADIEGLVLVSSEPDGSRADLRLPLQQLIVDDPGYPEQFGLEPELAGFRRRGHDAQHAGQSAGIEPVSLGHGQRAGAVDAGGRGRTST